MATMLTRNDKVVTTPPPDYTDDERKRIGVIRQELTEARNAREENHIEFDDMSYSEYYDSNLKADTGYIRPKENDQEVRLNSGITTEKNTALLSMLVNFNFEPNIKPFDKKKGREIEELGQSMEDLLKKSRLDEPINFEANRALMYQELLRHGDVFVEDLMREKWEIRKDFKGAIDFHSGFVGKQWSERVTLAWRKLSTEIISGLNFYPGNIRTFWMEDQPYIFTRKIIPYNVAEQMFGKWPRWKSVNKDLEGFGEGSADYTADYHNWSLGTLDQNQVEIIQYQNVPLNEYAIIINGILMTPLGFPLSYLTGKNRYTVVKGSGHPISPYFFYSKSIPAKTKTDQQVMDEFYRLMVLKTQQSFMPPMINRTKKNLDRRIFWPAQITSGMNPDDLQPLIQAGGVSQSELAAIDFIKRVMDEKSVSPTFQGQAMSGSQTAREIMELQKQSVQKLGILLLMVIEFEKNLAELRLENILHYWTRLNAPEVDDITQKLVQRGGVYEMDTTLEDGSNGTKIIEISDVQKQDEQLIAEADLLSMNGKNVVKVYLSPSLLRKIEITWKMNIEPTEKDSDALEAAMFRENYIFLSQAFPGRLNQDFWMGEGAKHAKVDKEQAFTEQPQMQPPVPGQDGGRAAQELGQAATPQTQRPSLNTLLNA